MLADDNQHQQQKLSKASVNFRRAEHPRDERCGICSMFRVPAGCTLVGGVIGVSMVCDEFAPRKKA
jgi:hypothetical protein